MLAIAVHDLAKRSVRVVADTRIPDARVAVVAVLIIDARRILLSARHHAQGP
jgi:hypothetical protein